MQAASTLTKSIPVSRRMRTSSHGYLMSTWLRLRRDRLTIGALIVFFLVTTAAVLAPWIAGELLHVDAFRPDLFNRYAAPSDAHLLGTDDLGRDVLARELYAGQVSLLVGFSIALVSILIGLPVGVASGYYGGRFDDLSNALIQTLLNIPDYFLFILLSVTLRPTAPMLAVLIGSLSWMGTARLVRAQALSLRQRDYVLAARAMGANDARIMLQHIFPNLFSVVTVIAGFGMAGGILAESGLSYLGLGVQPPIASWGNMLNSSLENVTRAPWLVISPGCAILVTVLSIFLIADGLRDALDPRLKY